jgi:hypothetical protein
LHSRRTCVACTARLLAWLGRLLQEAESQATMPHLRGEVPPATSPPRTLEARFMKRSHYRLAQTLLAQSVAPAWRASSPRVSGPGLAAARAEGGPAFLGCHDHLMCSKVSKAQGVR